MKRILITYLIFLVTVFCNPVAHGQTVDFVKENVVFNLDSAHFQVTSDLHFTNDHNQTINQAIFFPYSCESHVVKVDTVLILDVNTNSYIKPARRSIAGVLFQISFAPLEQKKLKVTYSQDHDGKLVGYVVTKVKYWQGALPQANYTLNVKSPSVLIDSTSFKPNKISQEDDKTVYSWYKTNFKPEKEFCVYFHVK